MRVPNRVSSGDRRCARAYLTERSEMHVPSASLLEGCLLLLARCAAPAAHAVHCAQAFGCARCCAATSGSRHRT